MKRAIVLCSGGIDSVVTAFYIKKRLRYSSLTILFFDYGQRAIAGERACAKECAKKLKADFKEIKLPGLRTLSFSLINKGGKANEIRKRNLASTREESRCWYVPFRNTVFLSYALALAESNFLKKKIGSTIFVGFKCEGNDHYPDTTATYVRHINLLQRAAGGNYRICAPLINKDKEDIIRLGCMLGVDFRKTWSCYVGTKVPCGKCLACALRKAGFYWAGLEDPSRC